MPRFELEDKRKVCTAYNTFAWLALLSLVTNSLDLPYRTNTPREQENGDYRWLE
jgi:hypothetical protein